MPVNFFFFSMGNCCEFYYYTALSNTKCLMKKIAKDVSS